MSSIIEGYNYDIFISYRQKDNKGDKWVSKFVEALKTELEATFKEDVSLYFDENPHDRLQETYDVDKSLEGKLKCLIFIPILSQTYCDPNSYAWQHEFLAFLQSVKNDRFGKDVKLRSGNVSSRILPIRIHDLEPEDVKLYEKETGSVLRAMDFVFKTSAGVNRPLKANEDHPQDNLNKTFYADQINKVAHAIKEIVTSIEHHEEKPEEILREVFKPVSVPKKSNKTKIIAVSIIGLVLIMLGTFFIPTLFKSGEPVKKSIAVLPFKLLSDEPDKQYLADGMMDAITLHLSKIKDLRVMSRTSVEQYRERTKTTRSIGQELDVEYLLEGSFQKFGDNVKLIVQLIKARDESHKWANEYNRNWKDIFSVQSEVAQTIAGELNAVISPEEKQNIEKTPTTSLTAYNLFERGREEQWKYWDNRDRETLEKAEDFFIEALEYDPEYALAYAGLAWVYTNKHFWNEFFSENFMDSVLILANKALSYDKQLSEAYLLRGSYYLNKGSNDKAILEYEKALTFNPNSWEACNRLGWFHFGYENTDFVKGLEYLHKAVSLNQGKELPRLLRQLGEVYGWRAGFPEKAKHSLQEAFKLDGDTIAYLLGLSEGERALRNYEKSIELLNKCYAIDSNRVETLAWLAYDYYMLDRSSESIKYVRKFQDNLKVLNWVYYSAMKRIGYVYRQNGFREEANHWFDEQRKISEESLKLGRLYSIDANYDLAAVYSFMGEKEKAFENLRKVTKIPVCPLWLLSAIKDEPLFNTLRKESEFQKIVNELETKYQDEHERVNKWMQDQGMK
ncbi:MAG TPA: hypothetical protein DDW27_11475 [Bacteroidales bacterium]|nr:hypothetical protein [Bacteroidales bacterium]